MRPYIYGKRNLIHIIDLRETVRGLLRAYRFLAKEQVIGSFASFARFEGYVPRDEPASFTSGGHRVLIDRIEWHMIPEAATAALGLLAPQPRGTTLHRTFATAPTITAWPGRARPRS